MGGGTPQPDKSVLGLGFFEELFNISIVGTECQRRKGSVSALR
jgi:hypothetical protein